METSDHWAIVLMYSLVENDATDCRKLSICRRSVPIAANNHYACRIVDRCRFIRAWRIYTGSQNWTGFNLQNKQNSDILTPTYKKKRIQALKKCGWCWIKLLSSSMTNWRPRRIRTLVCTRELVSGHTPAVGRHTHTHKKRVNPS